MADIRIGPRLVVAEPGPLVALAVAGALGPCLKMLGALCAPEPVLQACYSDLSAPGAAAVYQAWDTGQFKVIPAYEFEALDAPLAAGVGSAEVAVLAYAAAHGQAVWADERRTRALAQRLGVPVVGTGALLQMLVQAGWLAELEPVRQAWRQQGWALDAGVLAGP